MFIKKFTDWINLKKSLDSKDRSATIFKERDIWWCSVGCNVGDEVDGKSYLFNRPVLVLKKFNKNIFCGVPLSTKIKNSPYYSLFTFQNKTISAMLSHIRLFDKKRLQGRMGQLDVKDFDKIKKEVRNLFV